MHDIDSISEYAQQLAAEQNLANMVRTIEKELLHYEILDALDNDGLLDDLVFQGGTSLRLCYGAERYSEDLDFAGGQGFNRSDLATLKDCIEESVGRRYHVSANVKSPKKNDSTIATWTVEVDTSPRHTDIPRQRIKIEVASVDAHDAIARTLNVNYEGLPNSYADIILNVESQNEILADKVEAFVCSPHLRYRDLWDLAWLGKQPSIDMEKVVELRKLKESDYREIELYKERYPTIQEKLANAFESGDFLSELSRFLPASVISRTVQRPLWMQSTQSQLEGLFKQMA
ncbi:nucleotidyl transferase AbiEii/AbiGii toxin family protein [Bifidobacterium subtile]|jgi:predicted nucleotidyltransferase component of viral defense system|uniref:nucleotidyl transferase AbiEii/AbiGii toxin family protein n=1 Tax=Bifidobacterium subtile TaxID=77635 RepID=UPI002F35EC82